MARKAGVTADDTRRALLRAAADVFARLGYDGASIGDITEAAGLTKGAVYAHYESKADLFASMIRANAERELDGLLGRGDLDAGPLMMAAGSRLDRRDPAEGALLVEAIVAAKRDPAIGDLLTETFTQRHDRLVRLLHAGQAVGRVSDELSTDAIARFSMMVALGSLLMATLELPEGDHDEWVTLMRHVVQAFGAS